LRNRVTVNSEKTGLDKSIMEIMSYKPTSREWYPDSTDANKYAPYASIYVYVDSENNCEAGVRSNGGMGVSKETYTNGNIVFMGAAWNDYAEFRD
jgi:hypothetical protein